MGVGEGEELGGFGRVAQWGERDGDKVGVEGEKELTRWGRGRAGRGEGEREKATKT